MSTSSAVLSRYTSAFIDLAEESKLLAKVEKDMTDLGAMLNASDDLQALVNSPVTNKTSQIDAVQVIAKKAKFQTLTTNFLSILAQNGRLSALSAMIEAFFKEVSKRRGEQGVQVTVAQDLTAKQLKDLQASLKKSIGKDVAVDLHVDPSILGGMIVTIGSTMIDDSVAAKLDNLKLSMSTSSNENKVSNQNSPKESKPKAKKR